MCFKLISNFKNLELILLNLKTLKIKIFNIKFYLK